MADLSGCGLGPAMPEHSTPLADPIRAIPGPVHNPELSTKPVHILCIVLFRSNALNSRLAPLPRANSCVSIQYRVYPY